jgi:tetratricopeptide (TPR) repeat protein
MCWSPWASAQPDVRNTEKRFTSSKQVSEDALSRKLEEAQILWKLDEKDQAIGVAESVLEDNTTEPSVFQTLASFYVEQGRTQKARQMIAQFEKYADSDQSESIIELKASLALQEKQWAKALEYYQFLIEKHPDKSELQKSKADILVLSHRWKEAREQYEILQTKHATQFKKADWTTDYLRVIEEGAPSLSALMLYFRGPVRFYKLEQRGKYWLSPQLKVSAGLTEGYFRKKLDETLDRIHQFVMGHFVEGTYYYSDWASVFMKWQSSYYNSRDFNEGDIAVHLEKGIWTSDTRYVLHQLVLDPVESLSKEGTENIFTTQNRVLFFNRLEGGQELKNEWFYDNSSRNPAGQDDYLGRKITNDFYVNFIVLQKPVVAINYHYRMGYWRQSFLNADQVIPFLNQEQVHYGGFYTEHQLTPLLKWTGSVSRGSDRKRNVDYLVWYSDIDYWVGKHTKFECAYEYDYGDSGVSGGGNSQTITFSLSHYF